MQLGQDTWTDARLYDSIRRALVPIDGLEFQKESNSPSMTQRVIGLEGGVPISREGRPVPAGAKPWPNAKLFCMSFERLYYSRRVTPPFSRSFESRPGVGRDPKVLQARARNSTIRRAASSSKLCDQSV